MINWISILLIFVGIFLGIPFIFGEPTAMNILFGGGMTLFGIVFLFKNNFEFMTRYKKKSLGGKAVQKAKKAIKKRT